MTNILMYKKMTITGITFNCGRLTKEQNNVISFLYNKHRKNNKYTFEAVYIFNDHAILKVKENENNLTLLFAIMKDGCAIGNSYNSMLNVINKLEPIFTF